VFDHSSRVAAGVWVVAVVAIVFLLRAASQLLIPIVLAALISFALEPIVARMQRWHVPRAAGTGLLLATILALSSWGVYSLRDEAADAFTALPEVARRARELVWSRGQSTAGQTLRRTAEQLQPPSPSGGSQAPTGSSGREETGADAGSLVTQWLQRGVGSVLALAGQVTVIFFLVFFLLISGGHFRQRLLKIAGREQEDRQITARIIDDINAQIQRFLLVRLVTAVIVALATWGVLAWMNVGQAAVWGILAGVFNSIPYFGPIIVSGGLLLVGLVQSGEMVEAVKISGAALLITSLEGWLLTPALLGKAEHMHPVVVFLGVLVWTWIWGAWGTLLAVPMLVILKSMCDHVGALKPIGRLMSP
jgi:predicted PurR-regulated permease PerM